MKNPKYCILSFLIGNLKIPEEFPHESMDETKIFDVLTNIDARLIKEFLEFYQNGDKFNLKFIIFKFTGKKGESNILLAEVDPAFISYLILFLLEYQNINIQFSFQHYETTGRLLSLKNQLKQLVFLNPILKNRLFIVGQKLDKTTGALTNVNHDINFEPVFSKKFMPLMVLQSDEDITFYFSKNAPKNTFRKDYIKKFLSELDLIISKNKENDQFYTELEYDSLSFAEICILYMLLSEEIYPSRLVGDEQKKAIIAEDKQRILRYKQLAIDISRGMRELALNVVEHSSQSRGVISCRFFSKERLKTLKETSENSYLNSVNDEFFLDATIVDTGNQSVRETYVQNLSTSKNYLTENEGNSIENDISIIKDSYDYKDFFIINHEKYSNLTHQQNKIISRYGLHYFTHIITHYYRGYIRSSSKNEGFYTYKRSNEQYASAVTYDHVKYGTSYSCIIPINLPAKVSSKKDSIKSIKRDLSPPNFYTQLDKFQILDIDEAFPFENSKRISLLKYKLPKPIWGKSKYDRISDVQKYLGQIDSRKMQNILLLDAENFKENDSQWVRLLSSISLYFTDIIVYNISIDILKDLIKLRRSVDDLGFFSFWSNESRVLFYSFKTDKLNAKIKRFGATMLTGGSKNTFDIVNKNIWRHHYSFRKDVLDDSNEDISDDAKYIYDNSQLFSAEKLIYFELLISNLDEINGDLTLFERSIQFSLNKEFNSDNFFDTNNRGYKIVDTHFRLGSKIHIHDFYYAKRLFQNSFFTTPLAYLVAKKIISMVSNPDVFKYPSHSVTGTEIFKVTLIGYEDYSSFLTSTIRNFLEKYRNFNSQVFEFNHNTLKDGKLSKGIDTINQNVLIIVPIASSFSTSIKIKNQLEEIFSTHGNFKYKLAYNIYQTSLNIILVGHKTASGKTFEQLASRKLDNEASKTLGGDYLLFEDKLLNGTYNWISINKSDKQIRLRSFNETELADITLQKYFIPVYTQWKDADNCDLCNPEKITDEKCLIETGKSSITPTLIFGHPKIKMENMFGLNSVNLKHSILYGNIRRGKNHYLYFSRAAKIVANNKSLIIEWLKILREKIFHNQRIKYQKIVLLTPATGTKSNFIDLVHEYLFDYTANCLTISLGEDYIENTESLYADGLHQADIVIFVDDVLSTINSFLETNYIAKYIRNKSITGLGIDYCITLVNRMSFDCEDNLLLKLPKQESVHDVRLLYYTKINNPTIEEPNSEFPLTKEQHRYHDLASTASMDSIRELFLSKLSKLAPVNIEREVPDRIKDDISYQDKKLFQLLVLNRFYKLFEISKVEVLENGITSYHYKNDVSTYLTKDMSSLFLLETYILDGLSQDLHHKSIIDKYSHNVRYVLLKIICSSPLIYYKDIRNSGFNWILSELEQVRKELDGVNVGNLKDFFQVSYQNYFSKFQILKFLLKRSVQLKSNYIFHPTFLESLKKFIDLLSSVEQEINDKFKEVNEGVFNDLRHLYQNEVSFKDRMLVRDYIVELKNLKSDTDFDRYLSQLESQIGTNDSNKPQSELFTESDPTFLLKFNRIKVEPKYAFVSAKKFIYQLISLVQELINEHETKAVRLENNINNIAGKYKYKYDPEDNRNGNFNHFLRLLKLENTAVIEKFWEHFRTKESNNEHEKILTTKITNFGSKYANDPKYKAIKENLLVDCESAFNSFIFLKSKLYNWSLKAGESVELQLKVKQILKSLAGILGNDVNHIYFFVNYANKEKPSSQEIYLFEPYSHPNERGLKLYVNKENFPFSLTAKMFNPEIKNVVDRALSNIEIYKNKSGLHYRENMLDQSDISNFTELKDLSLSPEYSLLSVRISDTLVGQELYSQAVLTIISKKGSRIDESKLRLILLLRKGLSDFLKHETSNNTFLELLKNRSVYNYQKHLKHGIGNFTSYQKDIVFKYENIEDKIEIDAEIEDVKLALEKEYINKGSFLFKEFQIITNSISSQTGVSTQTYGENVFFYDYFIDVLQTIYQSKKLGDQAGSMDVFKMIKFKNKKPFADIKLPITLIESIIPEIIINQKKYGTKRSIDWKMGDGFFELEFSNEIEHEKPDAAEGYGLKMCKEIQELFKNKVVIYTPEKPYSKFFTVTIKIKI